LAYQQVLQQFSVQSVQILIHLCNDTSFHVFYPQMSIVLIKKEL